MQEFESMFDLPTSIGTTQSERFLSALCRRTFLSLWSFPNTFTSEGLRDGAPSSGKEFADVLIVFGDEVILFSDKDIKFDTTIDLNVAWPRWYKRAVQKSANQLYGARNWLLRFPDKVFLDAECKRSLPVSMPASDRARVHLVATTRGSIEACAERFPGSLGTHIVNTTIEGNDHRNHPFTIGIVDRSKPFVHVFDEATLANLLVELDTIADFVAYLSEREKFLSAEEPRIMATGEEQLLALYLSNGDESGNSFLPSSFHLEGAKLLSFDESHYQGLISNKRYQLKKKEDQISYYWDSLIEMFIQIGDPKHGMFLGEYIASDTETALRAMASESRFRRRILCQVFQGLLESAKKTPDQLRVRLFSTKQEPDIVYIFLAFPRLPGQSDENYRAERSACLRIYTQCAPLRWPAGSTFVGIAVDHPSKTYSGRSEDLIVITPGELSSEDLEELRVMADSVGILPADGKLKFSSAREYPSTQVPKSGLLNAKKDKKDARKLKKLSRKKNRR